MTGPTPRGDIARLHAIRALMGSLKDEEAQLRARLLTLPDGDHGAGGMRVRIVTTASRRLDQTALPRAVLDDPGLWKAVTIRSVRLLPGRTRVAADPLLERT